MRQNKLWNFLSLFCMVFLILPSTALADETELDLLENKASSSLQFAQGSNEPSSNSKFGLRIMGGGTRLMRNDFNEVMEGLNDAMAGISMVTVNSQFEPITLGTDFSGEILVNLTSNLDIGLGAGYILAEKESTLGVETNMGPSMSMTLHPNFSAIPVTLGLYYGIPLGSTMSVVLNGGVGYYLGTVKFDGYNEASSMGYTSEESQHWSTQPQAFGFHGGVDFEFGFTPNIAFVVGAKGRSVKFTDLTGTLEWESTDPTGGSSSGTEENQTLWFGHFKDPNLNAEFEQMSFSEDKPTGSNWSDVRKAEVNLSGLSFQAGIKINF